MGAGAAFPRTALLRENKACTLSAESFAMPVCPNSVDAVRADSARVVMVIFGTNCGFGLVEIIFIAMPAQLTAS